MIFTEFFLLNQCLQTHLTAHYQLRSCMFNLKFTITQVIKCFFFLIGNNKSLRSVGTQYTGHQVYKNTKALFESSLVAVSSLHQTLQCLVHCLDSIHRDSLIDLALRKNNFNCVESTKLRVLSEWRQVSTGLRNTEATQDCCLVAHKSLIRPCIR